MKEKLLGRITYYEQYFEEDDYLDLHDLKRIFEELKEIIEDY